MHYIFWLILSALFFAFGEFLSKKVALEPQINIIILTIFVYLIGILFWFPAIIQKNQLSIVGVIWSVLSLIMTVLIGVLIFGEKLNLMGIIGIITAIISVILLSIA